MAKHSSVSAICNLSILHAQARSAYFHQNNYWMSRQIKWQWVAICRSNSFATRHSLLQHFRSTCISRHLQLRTGGFCCCKVSLPACPCWWQPVHSNYGEDAGVLLNSVTHSDSVRLGYANGLLPNYLQNFLFPESITTHTFTKLPSIIQVILLMMNRRKQSRVTVD